MKRVEGKRQAWTLNTTHLHKQTNHTKNQETRDVPSQVAQGPAHDTNAHKDPKFLSTRQTVLQGGGGRGGGWVGGAGRRSLCGCGGVGC